MELICFSLIVTHNNYQRSLFFKHTSSFYAYTSGGMTNIKEYFSLRKQNNRLIEENLALKNQLERQNREKELFFADSLQIVEDVEVDYVYRSAKIINTTFNKTKNYITVNKGYEDGVREEMAVCSGNNVVGIIQNTSGGNSIVLPLININLRISAKIKKNNYYGSLQWDGQDYKFSYLKDIPFHVNVEQGDTIITSGFSSIFPEGEVVGFVEEVNKATANFLLIKVRLATDFKNVSDVYIIENRNREEQIELEQESYDVR